MDATVTAAGSLLVSVIVPARNEEASLGECLASLSTQEGVPFEIIVVDDHSTDRTREIAFSFPGVRVIEADPLPKGWTGKNNAVWSGVRAARGQWLLFTDADTVHQPGSLARALAEVQESGAELLSYSPQQIAVTFCEMATLPVVFAELARQYSLEKVNDPNSQVAAANGQYILVKREAYDAVGGHAAVAGDILEDVALARAVKSSGRRIRFRYAPNAVRTRMYRNYEQLRDGWTKNLVLLFPNPGWIAGKSLLWWGLAWGAFLWPVAMLTAAAITSRSGPLSWIHDQFVTLAGVATHWWWAPTVLLGLISLVANLRRANFPWRMEVLAALFGIPMFAYLMLRSEKAHAKGRVPWKGRNYSCSTSSGTNSSGPERQNEITSINQLSKPASIGSGRSL
jgi:glycosyltransferase involved in cell wall biosynthesis